MRTRFWQTNINESVRKKHVDIFTKLIYFLEEREARFARYALEVKLSSLSAQMGVQNKKLDALKKQQEASSSESGKMVNHIP